jgi:uncharacterized SAM-binding protein YcdF (DUF218 family)
MPLLRRCLLLIVAVPGCLLLVVTVTPVCSWWATRLSVDWNDPRGDTLVVLTGDRLDDGTIGVTSYWRSVECARVWRAGKFRKVIITGESRTCGAMRDFIAWSGVPQSAIALETGSLSTHDSAVHVAALLRREPGEVMLLTSDYHMYRACRAFRKAGLKMVPSPFPDALKRVNDPVERWGVFCRLAAETARIAYYAARGWL